MSLPGQLVRSKMVAFAVGCGCGLLEMRRLVVKFSSTIVWALRHDVLLSMLTRARWSYRPIHPPSTVIMVPVT
jgi:hypothetical protein